MSMQKLNRIRSAGAYTAQRSTLEHLLLLEERVSREIRENIEVPTARTLFARQLQQYKEQNKINNPFGIEDIQHYLLTTTERELNREKSRVRGIYTSTLIEQIEGDSPITIDMLGNKVDYLLYAINTPRNITINNTNGYNTGAYAGSDHGQANLTINNAEGDYIGAYAGSNRGQAYLTINNTNGDSTGECAGSDHGTAHLTINNTRGNWTGAFAGNAHGTAHLTINNTNGRNTGAFAGNSNGNTIIVAYNIEGEKPFLMDQGILVLKNPDSPPRIEGVGDTQKKYILDLIAQNAPSEDIMAYLRGNT